MKKSYYTFMLFVVCLLIFGGNSLALESNLDSKIILEKVDMSIKKITPKNPKINNYKKESNNFTVQSTSPSAMEWGYLFGVADEYDRTKMISTTTDGGYVIAGYSGSSLFITKTDSSGNTVWSYIYGSSLTPSSIQETSDNGYIVSGLFSNSSSDGIFILKLDSNGNVLWNQAYNGTFYDIEAKEFSDGYAIICSYEYDSDDTDRELYLFTTDLNGTILWDKYFDDSTSTNHNSVAIEIDELSNNIIAFSQGWYNLEDRISIYEVSSNGYILLKKVHKDLTSTVLKDVIQTNDGGFALIARDGDPTLVKLDSSFEISWSKSYSSTVASYISFSGLEQTSDNGFILCGQYQYPYPATEKDIWLLKTDDSGSKEWENIYNLQFYDYGTFVHQTDDGGYVVGGNTQPENAPTDIFLVKYY